MPGRHKHVGDILLALVEMLANPAQKIQPRRAVNVGNQFYCQRCLTFRCIGPDQLKIALLWSVCALLASLLIVPAALAQDADYVSNSKCKMCHNKKADGAIWTAWSAMAHAKALETLKGEEAKAIAEKAGLEKPAFESPECLRCHVTGYDAKKDPPVPAKLKSEQGIQCESCQRILYFVEPPPTAD